MKKNKTMALTLGLAMMTMSITPVFAQSTNANYVSSIVNKNSDNMVINLTEQTAGNIAVDLGLTTYQVESVLTGTYKQTKPAEKPENGNSSNSNNGNNGNKNGNKDKDKSEALDEAPAEVECEGPYQDVTTLPAETGDVPYTTLPYYYQEVTTLPAEVDGDVPYTTLPAEVTDVNQQPQICPPLYVDETVNQQPQICPSKPIEEETVNQQPQICPSKPIEDVDKETKPLTNPGKVISAIKQNDEINPVVVTPEMITTLAEMSGQSEEFVTEILGYCSVETIVTTEKQTPTTLPAQVQ